MTFGTSVVDWTYVALMKQVNIRKGLQRVKFKLKTILKRNVGIKEVDFSDK